jgi:hypothetical protein
VPVEITIAHDSRDGRKPQDPHIGRWPGRSLSVTQDGQVVRSRSPTTRPFLPGAMSAAADSDQPDASNATYGGDGASKDPPFVNGCSLKLSRNEWKAALNRGVPITDAISGLGLHEPSVGQ